MSLHEGLMANDFARGFFERAASRKRAVGLQLGGPGFSGLTVMPGSFRPGCRDCGVQDQIIPSAPETPPPVTPPIPGFDVITEGPRPTFADIGIARGPGLVDIPASAAGIGDAPFVPEIIREPVRPPPLQAPSAGPPGSLPCC